VLLILQPPAEGDSAVPVNASHDDAEHDARARALRALHSHLQAATASVALSPTLAHLAALLSLEADARWALALA
jgi:hypothetical protein